MLLHAVSIWEILFQNAITVQFDCKKGHWVGLACHENDCFWCILKLKIGITQEKFHLNLVLRAIQIIRDIFWHFSDPPPPTPSEL